MSASGNEKGSLLSNAKVLPRQCQTQLCFCVRFLHFPALWVNHIATLKGFLKMCGKGATFLLLCCHQERHRTVLS
jgi:hypothetical protein